MKTITNLLKNSFILLVLISMFISCSNVKKDWDNAKQKNTVEAYSDFITNHPESEFLSEAQNKIADLDWASAISSDSVKAYKDFIAKHTENIHIKEAEQKITDLEWKDAKMKNSIENYKKFIADYPKCSYIDSANHCISQLEGVWENGFLDKDYLYSENNVNKAIDKIFRNCMAFSQGVISNAYVCTYGVGDKDGNWSLNGKGGMVTVKIIKNKGKMTIGFKIDKGDKKGSQYFHGLLEEKLEEKK